MGRQYSHIDLAERRRIQKMRDAKVPVVVIAAELGRHRSTIHREIRRNFYHDPFRDRWGQEYRGYYCTTADAYARKRRARRAKLALRPELRDHVIAKLRAGWSPQQIAGRLRRKPLPCGTVSHETIYRFIYGPDGRGLNLYALLAVARRRRRQRSGRKPRSGPIPAQHWIANRPAEVVTRQSFGHWEGDLIIFARQFGNANVTSLQERRLPMASYFCDPHSPWQKGGVENANGRLRRFLPLATAEADRTVGALNALAERLNNTPRRCLDYLTPAEVFAASLAALTVPTGPAA
ncbi:IS30 family transposase [Azospirillum argentinense]|uniref:IS30 family transposase n=1 Tax=Azospirillum argentinense TaxID=2970906 RepID=A0A4D8P7A9_9PROT|nr:IS30 family transposase [Azospirillum argentinense]QCN94596.1 IS30 family transposase [Azospirillum argentinense]